MYTIQNKSLSVSISPLGAELQSVQNPQGKEWIYQAETWPHRAPLCFPTVGILNQNKYTHNGQTYSLPIHGFANGKDFACIAQTTNSITFQLQADDHTKESYPFDFELAITYRVEENRLEKTHQITNHGPEIMYYEIGGHDAFYLARDEDFLSIPKAQTLQCYQQDEDGLIKPQKLFLTQKDEKLSLDFRKHGLKCFLFANLPQRSVDILGADGQKKISLSFPDFPYLVMWTEAENFYCIEPWSSLPDCNYVSAELKDKINVRPLGPSCGETLTYTTTFHP